MKKTISIFTCVIVATVFISWGRLGHRTVGLIASRHLTGKTQLELRDLLGGGSLADVANWADDVRGSDPAYKSTGQWHYINLPLGLNRTDFVAHVNALPGDNVYNVLQRLESEMQDSKAPRAQKIADLKFIVHFVGDLHQPMHVSRTEDQGGNKIQVNYEGQGTNLHSFWDSKLLEHEGVSDEQLATKIDKASAEQIKAWQNAPLMDWLWESYQISSTLYKEVEAMSNRTITNAYYQQHIGIAEQRLEQAGIRLAGVLNMIFANPNSVAPPPPPGMNEPGPPVPLERGVKDIMRIEAKDVKNHIKEEVQVCAQVYGSKDLTGKVLLDLGGAYPNQFLTVGWKEKPSRKLKDGMAKVSAWKKRLFSTKTNRKSSLAILPLSFLGVDRLLEP
jgi:hypothetical protein